MANATRFDGECANPVRRGLLSMTGAASQGRLLREARTALARVASGETYTIAGWLAYDAALNEGRALFASDEQFGQWVAIGVNDNLSFTTNLHDRAAAIWAAAFPEQF